jgi:hypothetical protein
MNNMIQDAYKKTEFIRCILTLVFGVISYVIFWDVLVTIFTVVAITLAHELPTIFMGWYIFKKENH